MACVGMAEVWMEIHHKIGSLEAQLVEVHVWEVRCHA